jgi:hypothetical protein
MPRGTGTGTLLNLKRYSESSAETLIPTRNSEDIEFLYPKPLSGKVLGL